MLQKNGQKNLYLEINSYAYVRPFASQTSHVSFRAAVDSPVSDPRHTHTHRQATHRQTHTHTDNALSLSRSRKCSTSWSCGSPLWRGKSTAQPPLLSPPATRWPPDPPTHTHTHIPTHKHRCLQESTHMLVGVHAHAHGHTHTHTHLNKQKVSGV